MLNVDKNSEKVRFIWSIADLLLGPYCHNQYKDIMLPMTVLRRRNSVLGDSFTVDNFRDKSFDYILTNPPFGMEWGPQQSFIQKEHEEHGFGGRFGAGLPRINDGSPLFKAILMALFERDEAADICTDRKGNPEPDPELRDYEKVHLKDNITDYIAREVLPHVPDAWVDGLKTKIGYKINFNSYFYRYTPPRPLEEIEIDLKGIKKEIAELLEVMV